MFKIKTKIVPLLLVLIVLFLGLSTKQIDRVKAKPSEFEQFDRRDAIAHPFELGWYDIMNRPKTLSKIAREGFDSVIPYGGSSHKMIDTYLEAAQAANIKVFLPLNPNLKQVKIGEVAGIQQKIRRYKDRQAVYGWYIADEPDFNKVPPQDLEAVYRVVKAEDPSKPVAIAFNSNAYLINKYKNAFDILMYDKYPCNEGAAEFALRPGAVNMDFARKRFQQLGDYARANNKQYIPILQGFGNPHDPMKVRRFCTQAESRYLIYSSILSNADGLFFWAHFATEPAWVDSVLMPLTQELKTYLPAIKNRSSSCKVRPYRLDIQGCLYQKPNSKEYLLIAAHHGRDTVTSKIRVRTRINTNSAKVLTEDRAVDFSGQILSDTFKPYQVHVYQLSES